MLLKNLSRYWLKFRQADTKTMMKAKLAQEIQNEYFRLIKIVNLISQQDRSLKKIDLSAGKVSVADLVAYQIGWGSSLIRWYETGVKGEMVIMPGDGFSVWDYAEIAKHFYEKYQYDAGLMQEQEFNRIVSQIITIVEVEFQNGNLDELGIWPWCTLKSGKQWPLSKWVKVNTCSPYRRAAALIRKWLKER